MSDPRSNDALLVRNAVVGDLKIHVRISDQALAPDALGRQRIAEALPEVVAFAQREFVAVKAVLDWDHQLPSQALLLRIFAAYTPQDLARIEAQLRERDLAIGEHNLYPEFDVPDYGAVEASENYATLLRPGSTRPEDFQFVSEWRRQVDPSIAKAATDAVTGSKAYHQTVATRRRDGLGSAVVVGWAPPCIGQTGNWAVEVWVLIDFDGQTGSARVFMVDSVDLRITRVFETNVELS